MWGAIGFKRCLQDWFPRNERQKLARLVGQKDQVIKELQEAQQKFARANNFWIEKVKGVSSL